MKVQILLNVRKIRTFLSKLECSINRNVSPIISTISVIVELFEKLEITINFKNAKVSTRIR